MAHPITLTDEDYAALAAAAASIEQMGHEALVAHFPRPTHRGTCRNRTGAPMTRQQREAMERLAQKIGSQHPWASEIVIEDRGPR